MGLQRLRIPVLARFMLPVIGIVGVAVALRSHVFDLYNYIERVPRAAHNREARPDRRA